MDFSVDQASDCRENIGRRVVRQIPRDLHGSIAVGHANKGAVFQVPRRFQGNQAGDEFRGAEGDKKGPSRLDSPNCREMNLEIRHLGGFQLMDGEHRRPDYTDDSDRVRTASISRSNGTRSTPGPQEKRTDEEMRSTGRPIAASTWLRDCAAEEQAAPLEKAMKP